MERTRLRRAAEGLRARSRLRAATIVSSTLCVFLATLALSVYLFVIIPKGFFPQQDTGLITGISEAGQDVSFADMMRHQEALGEVVRKDPAVDHVAMSVGGGGNPLNNGRMFITLKPRDERDATADQVIARLRPQLDKVEGARLFLQAAQDVSVGGRASRTQYQYTLQDPDIDELNQWAPKVLAKLKTLPELRDVATDQQIARHDAHPDDRSRPGLALRPHAAGDRRHALRRLRPAPDRPVFHAARELPRDHGNPAGAAGRGRNARQDLSQVADHRQPGAAFDLRQMDDRAGPAAVDQPSGPVPGDHHQLQPRALVALGTGDRRHRAGRQRAQPAGHHHHQLPGQCPGVPGVAVAPCRC